MKNLFVEDNSNYLWENHYKKAARRETDVHLVRDLYEARVEWLEERIRELEAEVEELKTEEEPMEESKLEQLKVDWEAFASCCEPLKHNVEQIFKIL